MTYFLYIFFGLAPSIIWLLFYLRKDSHPESNSMILKIFFCGMLAALPAAFLELGLLKEMKELLLPSIFISVFYPFLGIAFVEEIFKYLAVKFSILGNPEFDEPLDAMLYMIIAALGFAALENMLILAGLGKSFQFFETLTVTSLRFVGATFLHALASGLVGYFIALSFCGDGAKRRFWLIAAGLGMATTLHGFYNFSIITIDGNLRFVIPIIILITLALFISYGFERVKKLKSVC